MDITYKNQKGITTYLNCFEKLRSCRYAMISRRFEVIDSTIFDKWFDEQEKLSNQLKKFNETYSVKPNVFIGQCFKDVTIHNPYYQYIKYYRVEGIDENKKVIHVTSIDKHRMEEACLKFCYFNETRMSSNLIEISSAEFERVIEALKLFG